jgi:hypothetical protein
MFYNQKLLLVNRRLDYLHCNDLNVIISLFKKTFKSLKAKQILLLIIKPIWFY